MNANELATCLEMRIIYGLPLKEAATMLRQQAAEIEILKAYKEAHKILWDERNEALKSNVAAENTSQERVDETQNNRHEPAAWMETYKGEPNNLDWDKNNLNYGSEFHDVVPLYTHPVKELILPTTITNSNSYHRKELTDEEIFSIAIDCTYGGDLHADKFARAILIKAQENG